MQIDRLKPPCTWNPIGNIRWSYVLIRKIFNNPCQKPRLTNKSIFNNRILIISAYCKFPYVGLQPNPVHNLLFSLILLLKSKFLVRQESLALFVECKSPSGTRYSGQSCISPIGSCRLLLCCETISEKRSAGNLHATFRGNRRWVTAHPTSIQ